MRSGFGFLSWNSLQAAGVFLALCGALPAAAQPFPLPGPGNPFARRFLALTLNINANGVIDTTGRGYYIFLINVLNQQIECTDLDTFSDFVRFDGRNWDWYHRQANLPHPGFQFFQAANLNIAGRVGTDARSLEIVFDLGEPTNILNQFVQLPRFTCHVVTCDNYQNAIIGRPLDTLGQGPDFGKNSLQTVHVMKTQGATIPLPQFYPVDPLTDFITQPDLPPDFPYNNFDISRFEVTVR